MELNFSLFMYNMIEQVENPKDSPYKLIKLICELSKFIDFKVNIKTSNKTDNIF